LPSRAITGGWPLLATKEEFGSGTYLIRVIAVFRAIGIGTAITLGTEDAR
jgi:hypothetical protein